MGKVHLLCFDAWAIVVLTVAGPSKLQELLGVTRIDPTIPLDPEHEVRNDKAKQFSQKSIEELTYLLSPPSFPPPPEPSIMSNSAYAPHDPMSVARDAYLVQQHRQQQQMSMSQLPSLPNHPPPVRMAPEYMPSSNSAASYPQEHLNLGSNQDGQQVPITLDRDLASAQPTDEVEQISYTVDASDEQIRQRDISSNIKQSSVVRDESDDWNFDDTSLIPQQAEPPQTRRLDTDPFPSANNAPIRSPPRPHRRKSSGAMGMIRRRSDGSHDARDTKQEVPTFKVKFALRGHLDVVRSVIFTGGGSPSEPEVCTTGDDGLVKRWIIPSSYGNFPTTQQQNGPLDLDIQSYFTHRGHEGMVTCLAASPPSASFSTGGRALGDGWVFSGGQDATILVWERGRVDPKARLEGHTDAIWALCVLPAPAVAIFGQNPNIASGDRILLISGAADHTVKIWAVSSPPQLTSPQNSAGGGRRGVGGTRRHSLSSGSNFPSSPQPSTASGTPFHYTLIHSIELPHNESAVPTSIAPLGSDGENFVVAYSDSSIIVFDTRTGDEMVGMQSSETYDGTRATGVNAVVVTSNSIEHGNSEGNEDEGGAPTARDSGMEGVVISGHEDRFVKFFDANSGMWKSKIIRKYTSLANKLSLQANAHIPCWLTRHPLLHCRYRRTAAN